jgi:hypothetical protein
MDEPIRCGDDADMLYDRARLHAEQQQRRARLPWAADRMTRATGAVDVEGDDPLRLSEVLVEKSIADADAGVGEERVPGSN